MVGIKSKKKKPTLTVLIPAYNCAGMLEKGIYSLVTHKLKDRLEVIIVNDGSQDDTLAVAKKIQKAFLNIKIIDKENGGHGSTINEGIKMAMGKYFRVMDADDYFDTKGFEKFLEKLGKEDADIVLSDFAEDWVEKQELRPMFYYKNLPKNKVLDIEEMTKENGFKEFGPLMATTTCKTELLRKTNFKLDEKCFYVDMEYNFMTYLSAKTIVYYPINIYRYVRGQENQSVSVKMRAKNYLQHEMVCFRLIKEYESRKEKLSEGKRAYLKNYLVAPMCDWHYYTILHYVKSQNAFQKFDEKLKKYPEFYNAKNVAGKVVRLCRKTKGFGMKIIVFLSELIR